MSSRRVAQLGSLIAQRSRQIALLGQPTAHPSCPLAKLGRTPAQPSDPVVKLGSFAASNAQPDPLAAQPSCAVALLGPLAAQTNQEEPNPPSTALSSQLTQSCQAVVAHASLSVNLPSLSSAQFNQLSHPVSQHSYITSPQCRHLGYANHFSRHPVALPVSSQTLTSVHLGFCLLSRLWTILRLLLPGRCLSVGFYPFSLIIVPKIYSRILVSIYLIPILTPLHIYKGGSSCVLAQFILPKYFAKFAACSQWLR
jgi:hypothetical protein